jgi:hypothetical protein
MDNPFGAPHPQHGAILSELRSLGFTTSARIGAAGYLTHAASLRRDGRRHMIVLPPTTDTPGAVLEFNFTHNMVTSNWSVPAECLSDVVRDHLSGVEVARMHGQNCVCVHPDAL